MDNSYYSTDFIKTFINKDIQVKKDDGSFENILDKYASVDNTYGTDKTLTHSYGPLYSKLFSDIKQNNNVKNILEIGVYSGASVQSFSEYFEEAFIYGIDIDLSYVKFGNNNERIKFIQGDATSEGIIKHIDVKFDIILDDASHKADDQLRTLDIFSKHLEKNGIYIIEDISSYYDLNQLKNNMEKIASNNGIELIEWHDMRETKNRYDDIVAIFKKV